MVGSSALMGISLFLFATVNTEASNVGLNAMVCKISEYFFPMVLKADMQNILWMLLQLFRPIFELGLLLQGNNADFEMCPGILFSIHV